MRPVPRVDDRAQHGAGRDQVPGFTTPFNLATRRPDEEYLYFGGTGNATPPQLHTYVTKLQAGTAK